MNIDTGKTRLHGSDTPEVKALRERVAQLESVVADLKRDRPAPKAAAQVKANA